jgi:hypothetical protein
MVLARLLPLLLPLSACIVLPVPLGEGHISAGREVSRESQGSLSVGSTTRAEVLARLGEPSAVWDDAGVVVYDWDRVQWLLLWMVAGAGRAATGGMELPVHHMLLLQFGAAGILQRAEHAERPAGVGYGAFLRTWAARGDRGA